MGQPGLLRPARHDGSTNGTGLRSPKHDGCTDWSPSRATNSPQSAAAATTTTPSLSKSAEPHPPTVLWNVPTRFPRSRDDDVMSACWEGACIVGRNTHGPSSLRKRSLAPDDFFDLADHGVRRWGIPFSASLGARRSQSSLDYSRLEVRGGRPAGGARFAQPAQSGSSSSKGDDGPPRTGSGTSGSNLRKDRRQGRLHQAPRIELSTKHPPRRRRRKIRTRSCPAPSTVDRLTSELETAAIGNATEVRNATAERTRIHQGARSSKSLSMEACSTCRRVCIVAC